MNKSDIVGVWDPASFTKGLGGVPYACASGHRKTDLHPTVDPSVAYELFQLLLSMVQENLDNP